MRNSARKLLTITAVMAAIVFVANLAVDNPYSHRLVRAVINEKLAAHTKINLEFQALEVQAFPLGATLYGVKITHHNIPDKPLLQAAQISARVSLTSLIMGAPALGLVETNELKLAYPLPPEFDGILIEPTPTQMPPLWPPNFALPIERFVAINSRLDFVIPADKTGDPDVLAMHLDGLNLDYRHDNWRDMELALDIRSTNLFIWNRHLVQDAVLVGEWELDNKRVTSNHVELTSRNVNFTADTAIDLVVERDSKADFKGKRLFDAYLTRLAFDIKAHARNSDLEVLGTFLDIGDTKGRTEGEVNLKLDIPLTPDGKVRWDLKGVAEVDDARLYGFQLFDSRAAFAIDGNAIRFTDITVKRDDQRFAKASGYIGFNDAVSFSFNAAPEGMPLTTMLEAVKVPDFKVLDGAVTAQSLSVKGTGFPFKMDIQTKANLARIEVPLITFDQSRFPQPPACQMNIQLHANQKGLAFDGTHGFCESREEALPPLDSPWSTPQPGSALKLSGLIGFDANKGMDLRIEAPALDTKIAEHFAQVSLSGVSNTRARVHGPYEKLRVEAAIDSDNITVSGMDLGKTGGAITVLAEKKVVEFSNFNAKFGSKGFLNIQSGTLAIADNFPIDLKIEANNLPPEMLGSLFHGINSDINMTLGVDDFKGRVKGPLLFPLAYETTADFNLTDLRFDNQLYFSRLQGRITSDKTGWQLSDGVYTLADFQSGVTAKHKRRTPFSAERSQAAPSTFERLGISRRDEIQIAIKTVSPQRRDLRPIGTEAGKDHLRHIPFVGPKLLDIGIAGEVELNAELEGTFEGLSGRVEGALANPVVFNSPIAPVRFKGHVDQGKVNLTEITHSGSSLIGRMNMDFTKEGVPFDWYFSFNGFDLRAFTPAVFYNDPRNFAYLTAQWNLKGKFQDFWRAQGDLQIDSIEAVYVQDGVTGPEKVELRHEFPVTLKMDHKGWYLTDNRELYLKSNYGSLFIDTKDNAPPGNLNINVNGSLDAAILKQLFPIVETARGKVVFRGSIQGSVSDPKIAFHLEDKKVDPFNIAGWEPLTIGFTDLPPAFTNIRMDINWRENKIEVTRLTADKGKAGKVSITGNFFPFAEDRDLSSILINIDEMEINRYPVPVFKSADMTLDGDLILRGNRFPLNLTGNVRVVKAQSLSNFDVRNQIIDTIRRRKINSTPSAPEEPLLNLDVQVLADDSITIKNRNLVAKVSSDLRVVGTEKAPAILGQVSVPRGKFNYKRDFNIQRGIIQFDEPVSPPDPRLDIIGESQVSRYRVQVIVSGYASDPKVALICDPPSRPDGTPITKLDILLLLTSGRLPDGERNIGASENAARSEALNLVIGQFEEPIERLFDLSGQTVVRQVYLDTYTSEDDGDPVARLNLPISISDEVNFIFQVDNDSNMKISSEYSLHDSISVSGSFDKKKENETKQQNKNLPADTDTGVDLKFRFSFP